MFTMATVAFLGSGGLAFLLILSIGLTSGGVNFGELLRLFAVPLTLVAVIVVPALAFGRLPGRFTAISGWVWLVAAVALFAVPATDAGLGPISADRGQPIRILDVARDTVIW